jgi:spermidine/putrescine transport system ATP-binding protein
VSKAFGSVEAVADVSVRVRPGEFYSLLGPSGCGKTTTLRLVAGFELPDRGRIVLDGSDITGLPPNRRQVNTVFQQYALFPHMTVADNVAYGLKQKRLDRTDMATRLDDALRLVRLEELRDRYPRELSGGQQQRVALARALVNEPSVLLLDEPLAALDLKLRRAMQQELKKLQERVGISFVYVTHDQEEALTLSDRIAVMNQGRLLQEGTPTEIYERPLTRFVADFIGDTNLFEGVVQATGEEVLVRSGDLVLRCSAAKPFSVGENVVVSVRPEALREADSGSHNQIQGTLARTTYLGDLFHFHVETDNGREIVMQRQNDPSSESSGWRVGERVSLGWHRRDSLVLVDDEAATEDPTTTGVGNHHIRPEMAGEGRLS